jgi:hypothetical protein
VHDLPREELRHGEPDNVRNSGCVGNDPADLRAAKAVWLGAQAQHDLVAVDGVDIEVDRQPGTARGSQLVQHGLAGVAQIVRAERADAPLRDIGVVVLLPGVQPDQRNPFRRHGGRQ